MKIAGIPLGCMISATLALAQLNYFWCAPPYSPGHSPFGVATTPIIAQPWSFPMRHRNDHPRLVHSNYVQVLRRSQVRAPRNGILCCRHRRPPSGFHTPKWQRYSAALRAALSEILRMDESASLRCTSSIASKGIAALLARTSHDEVSCIIDHTCFGLSI